MTLFLNEKWILGLLDTGADVSVVAATHLPKSWPCQKVGLANPLLLICKGEELLMAPSRVLSRSVGGIKRDTQGFLLLMS
jgi:hypothetical protein